MSFWWVFLGHNELAPTNSLTNLDGCLMDKDLFIYFSLGSCLPTNQAFTIVSLFNALPIYVFFFFNFFLFSFLICVLTSLPTYHLLTHMAGPSTYMAIPPTHLPTYLSTIISSSLVMNQTYQHKKTPSHHPNI